METVIAHFYSATAVGLDKHHNRNADNDKERRKNKNWSTYPTEIELRRVSERQERSIP